MGEKETTASAQKSQLDKVLYQMFYKGYKIAGLIK